MRSHLLMSVLALMLNACNAPNPSLSIPVRTVTSLGASSSNFTKGNWSSCVKQQGNIQVYVTQTPDFYEVVEQEIPRNRQDFNDLDDAIAYANQHYAAWPVIPLEPVD